MQNTRKIVLSLFSMFLFSTLTSNALATQKTPKPMIVNCSISNQGFKDIDFEYKVFEKINLYDVSTRGGGNHLVKSTEKFDFWVSTFVADISSKIPKVTDFKVEIRNKDSSLAYQAINHATGDGLLSHLSLVKYSKENIYWPVAEIIFKCKEDMNQ